MSAFPCGAISGVHVQISTPGVFEELASKPPPSDSQQPQIPRPQQTGWRLFPETFKYLKFLGNTEAVKIVNLRKRDLQPGETADITFNSPSSA